MGKRQRRLFEEHRSILEPDGDSGDEVRFCCSHDLILRVG
jgi:hypothetical protein